MNSKINKKTLLITYYLLGRYLPNSHKKKTGMKVRYGAYSFIKKRYVIVKLILVYKVLHHLVGGVLNIFFSPRSCSRGLQHAGRHRHYPVTHNHLRSRVVSEEEGWAALELVLTAQLAKAIGPVHVQRHKGRVAGCQAGAGHRHAVAHNLEGIGEGLAHKVWKVGSKFLHFPILEKVGVDEEGDGGRYRHQGNLSN